MRAYWWRGWPAAPVRNFGDELTPYLLRKYCHAPQVAWRPVSSAQVVAVGSVLEHIPPLWEGHVIGAGKLFEDSRLQLYTGTAVIHAVRGPLSARGVPGDFAIGDAGLLADELIEPQERIHKVGVLPHWKDYDLVPSRLQYDPLIIWPDQPPLTVIRQIAQCQRLVTSSLHGLVLADALGIPRRFEYCRALDAEGGLFKFRDYSLSIQAPCEPGSLYTAHRSRVDDRKHELEDAFRSLRRAFSG